MSGPTAPPDSGASPRLFRLGPSLSLVGLASWVVTVAFYVLLRPEETIPGEPMPREAAVRLVLAFVIAAVGIFASSIVSAFGLVLSLAERNARPGRRASRGVVLGAVGVGALGLVVAEIVRVAFSGP